VRYRHKCAPGDKIYELARLSPTHVLALEALVDEHLRNLKTASKHSG